MGRLDVVPANARIVSYAPIEEMTDQVWDDMIDTNLSGVFKTVRAALPHLKANEHGGAIVLTSSIAGIKGGGIWRTIRRQSTESSDWSNLSPMSLHRT